MDYFLETAHFAVSVIWAGRPNAATPKFNSRSFRLLACWSFIGTADS